MAMVTKAQREKRGYERVHTVACYQDTWNKFNLFKHSRGLTADQAMNVLVDSYTQTDDVKQRDYLTHLRDVIQSKISKLNREIG